MKIRKFALAAAALSLAASPAIAQAAFDRSSAPFEGESEMEGTSGLLIAALAAAAVVGTVIAISDSDDEPTSP